MKITKALVVAGLLGIGSTAAHAGYVYSGYSSFAGYESKMKGKKDYFFKEVKFSEAVSLTGFMARFADCYDDYLVKDWNAVTESWDYVPSGKLYGYGGVLSVAAVDIAKDYVSKYFWIDTKDKGDEFKLTKISAERVSEVPLPAGAVLLLSGLGLLGLRRGKG